MLHGLGVTAESRRPMGRPQIPEANIPPQAAGGGVEDASPEEQALYNRVVALALLALYDEKMMPKTLKFIEQSSDPVEAVSAVASQIGMRVAAKAKEDGVDMLERYATSKREAAENGSKRKVDRRRERMGK